MSILVASKRLIFRAELMMQVGQTKRQKLGCVFIFVVVPKMKKTLTGNRSYWKNEGVFALQDLSIAEINYLLE